MTTAFYATGTGVGSIRNGPGAGWSAIHDAGSGTAINTGNGYISAEVDTGPVYAIHRYLCPIDTSALGATATITGATLKIYTLGDVLPEHEFNAAIVATTPASNTAIALADYSAFGATVGSDIVSLGASTDYTFTFNATGLDWINKTGYTQIGIRNHRNDISNVAPSYYDYTTILFEASKYITLTITYTKPSSGAFLAFM